MRTDWLTAYCRAACEFVAFLHTDAVRDRCDLGVCNPQAANSQKIVLSPHSPHPGQLLAKTRSCAYNEGTEFIFRPLSSPPVEAGITLPLELPKREWTKMYRATFWRSRAA